MKKEKLPVIIRMEIDTDGSRSPVAFFPTLPGTHYDDMTCYARVGQHSTASDEYMRECKTPLPSDDVEVKALINELKCIYELGKDSVILAQRRRNHPQYFHDRVNKFFAGRA